MRTADTNVAWAMLAKRANFLDRMLELRNKDTKSRAWKDGIMSSIPLLGEPLQFISDYKHKGPLTAVDRAAYLQYHPAHFAAGPIAALLGAASAPLLAKNPRALKFYKPLNKLLLGDGPDALAPALGIGLANTAAFGLAGNYGTRGALSYNYTQKHASYQFHIPDSAEQKEEKRIRSITGVSPTAPLLASRLYALNAPLYRDIDAVEKLSLDDRIRAYRRMDSALKRHSVAMAPDRYNSILRSSQPDDKLKRVGLLMRQMLNMPGAYMEMDSPLAKALAANLYSEDEIKGMKGMITGTTSRSPFASMFLGGAGQPITAPALHVAAHEMGHATQPKWMKSMPTRMGLLGPAAAVAAPVLSDNESLSLTAAGLGTAAATPALIGEFSASSRGKNFLRQWVGDKNWAKMKPLAKLSPFVGLPTYLAAASLPWVAYGTKKYLGGYDRNK